MSTCEKNLAKNFVKLKHIIESKPRIRKLLLEKANKGTIQALFDLIYNIMIGKIPVSQENIKKLKKHKKFLRTIIKPELNFKQKIDADQIMMEIEINYLNYFIHLLKDIT